MRISEKIINEINQKAFSTSGKSSVVGLDGFVDKIVTPVDKRHGLGENFDPIDTIADLGNRISAAAGKVRTWNFSRDLKSWEEMDRSWQMPCFHLA